MFSKEPAAFPRSVALKKQKNKLTFQKSLKSVFFMHLINHLNNRSNAFYVGPFFVQNKLSYYKLSVT